MSTLPPKTSRLKGFYKLQRGARLDALRLFTESPLEQSRVLGQDGSLPFEMADLFIENAVGSYPLPLGIATSFLINGHDYVVPMAVEESSVIAAASNAAKIVYECGGFKATTVSDLMIGQIQILDIPVGDFAKTRERILSQKEQLIQMANEIHPRLLMRGGGTKDLEVFEFPEAVIPFMVVHVLLDTREAMGANLVNTVCERLAPEMERITGGRVGLRILSNLADRKTYRVTCRVSADKLALQESNYQLDGVSVAKRIVEAYVFADNDPHRAATHNKGIMNGIDPVAIATGQDWRAIEAGAHAYAARSGRYRSLTTWSLADDGDLLGSIVVPMQIGTVGGVTRLHPVAQTSLQILGSPSSETLAWILASAGLASNLSALRALVSTGIQRGHMRLHAKNLALAAGARGKEVELLANMLVAYGKITATAAEDLLNSIRDTSKIAAEKTAIENGHDHGAKTT